MAVRTMLLMPLPAYLGNPKVDLPESLDLQTEIALATVAVGASQKSSCHAVVNDARARNAARSDATRRGSDAARARRANANHRAHLQGK